MRWSRVGAWREACRVGYFARARVRAALDVRFFNGLCSCELPGSLAARCCAGARTRTDAGSARVIAAIENQRARMRARETRTQSQFPAPSRQECEQSLLESRTVTPPPGASREELTEGAAPVASHVFSSGARGEAGRGASLLRDLLDAPTALAACCGLDLCRKYILYLH